jgi:hypothetical protein
LTEEARFRPKSGRVRSLGGVELSEGRVDASRGQPTAGGRVGDENGPFASRKTSRWRNPGATCLMSILCHRGRCPPVTLSTSCRRQWRSQPDDLNSFAPSSWDLSDGH